MGGEKLKQNSKMKTLRMFATTLMMVVLCLNFSACGDDDDKDAPSNYFTVEELVNTTWVGSNVKQDAYVIKLTSKTDLTLNITSKSGTVYVDNAALKYEYNAENGSFTSSYEGTSITGKITKTSMTFSLEGEKITLNKK